MRHVPVNLSELAESVIADLRQAEPDRVVDVRIALDMVVTGDPVLLRTALANLLQNAWKFTSQRPVAVIEVGKSVGSQEAGFRVQGSGGKAAGDQASYDVPVFFVRDNGVGFDMQYADKLFTPFQRLHAMTEFPGSGIGLATVQRVINRHNGRIWFEAVPGQGATFYFTIGADA
jgi:light-regulated signal transduction histidine kinase (bacteriophytochrome)